MKNSISGISGSLITLTNTIILACVEPEAEWHLHIYQDHHYYSHHETKMQVLTAYPVFSSTGKEQKYINQHKASICLFT